MMTRKWCLWRHRPSEIGSTMVEFCLIVPILFMIGFGGITFGKFMVSYERLSNVSYEAGKTAFKSCRGKYKSLQECLDGVVTKLEPLIQSSGLKDGDNKPDAEVIISVYDKDPAGGGIVLRGAGGGGGGGGLTTPMGRKSRWNVQKVSQLSVLAGTAKRRVMIAEAFHTEPVNLPFMSFVFPVRPKEIYEATIF